MSAYFPVIDTGLLGLNMAKMWILSIQAGFKNCVFYIQIKNA